MGTRPITWRPLAVGVDLLVSVPRFRAGHYPFWGRGAKLFKDLTDLLRGFLGLSWLPLRACSCCRGSMGDMPKSRVEAGRRRARSRSGPWRHRRGGFVVALALVRQGHPRPRPAPAPHPIAAAERLVSDDASSGSMVGGGSIAPSSSVSPPVATATS